MLERSNISFPLLELLMVQLPAGHLYSFRCRSDISFRYESFCERTSIGWTFSVDIHSIYSSYKIFWGYCGSPLRKPAHPSDQIGAGMQPEHLVILVCHTCYMWWPRMVAWRLISKAEQNETAFPLSSVHFL